MRCDGELYNRGQGVFGRPGLGARAQVPLLRPAELLSATRHIRLHLDPVGDRLLAGQRSDRVFETLQTGSEAQRHLCAQGKCLR